MRISMKQQIGYVLGGLVLVLFFQNCGQPGSITSSLSEKGTGTVEPVDPVTPPPVDPEVPTPVVDPVYKTLVKNVNVQSTTSQVDILVVIDNSGSMKPEQKNMADRFDTFIDQLQGLDWRVAITTTEVAQLNRRGQPVDKGNDGQLLRFAGTDKYFLSKNDELPLVKQAFAATIQRREQGSGAEQGIRATYRSLERAQVANSMNAQFVRPNAALAVIVVTDADETPFGQMTHRNLGQKLREYISTTYPSKAFTFHSIIVKRTDKACLEMAGSENESYGLHYQHLSEKTNGIVGSVCEADYGSQLKMMGQATAELVKLVTLECEPVDQDKNGMVDVKITNTANQAIVSDFVVNKAQIQFSQALPVGQYKIEYKCVVSAQPTSASMNDE